MSISEFFSLLKLCWIRAGGKLNLLILITFFTTILELIGFGMVIPLINLSFSEGPSQPSDFSIFFNKIFSDFGFLLNFNLVLLTIVIIFLCKGFFVFLGNNLQIWLTTGIRKSIQNQIISLYEKVEYRYFLSKRIGDHTNVLIRECERYQTVVNNISKGFVALTSAFFFILTLTILDTYFFIFLVIFSFLIFYVFVPIIKKTKIFSFSNVKLYSNLNASLIELIQNYSYLKGTFRTEKFTRTIYDVTDQIVKINRRLGVFSNILGTIKEPIGVLIIASLIFFKVSILNEPLPEVLVLGLILYRVTQKIMDIQNHWQRLNESIAGVFHIEEVIKELNNQQEKIGKSKKVDLTKKIEFKNVDFSYDKRIIIKNCSLTINPKEIIGIKGKSGEGKTTFIKLIMKLVEPNRGKIFFGSTDSIDIFANSIRSGVGYVTQDVNLFNGTLRENISFWDHQSSNLERKLKKSMDLAGCLDLFDRIDENVGDQALKLSGGQKQRVLIAREIFKEPKILIFDEPTSSLDLKNEITIKKTIKYLKKKYTVVLISHRASLLEISDSLYVLRKGKMMLQQKKK